MGTWLTSKLSPLAHGLCEVCMVMALVSVCFVCMWMGVHECGSMYVCVDARAVHTCAF